MDAHTLLSLIGWAVELSPAVLLVKVLLRDESRERYVWVVVLHPESRATVGVRVFGVRAVSCGVVTWMYHHPHMCAARGDDSLALAAPRHTAAGADIICFGRVLLDGQNDIFVCCARHHRDGEERAPLGVRPLPPSRIARAVSTAMHRSSKSGSTATQRIAAADAPPPPRPGAYAALQVEAARLARENTRLRHELNARESPSFASLQVKNARLQREVSRLEQEMRSKQRTIRQLMAQLQVHETDAKFIKQRLVCNARCRS